MLERNVNLIQHRLDTHVLCSNQCTNMVKKSAADDDEDEQENG
jgi:hypothetical protein